MSVQVWEGAKKREAYFTFVNPKIERKKFQEKSETRGTYPEGYNPPLQILPKITKIFQETWFAAAAIAMTNTTGQMTVAKSANKAEDLRENRWIVVIILMCMIAKLKFEKNN